jgi:hypothetical protein
MLTVVLLFSALNGDIRVTANVLISAMLCDSITATVAFTGGLLW